MTFVKVMVDNLSGESNPRYVCDTIKIQTYIHSVSPDLAGFFAQNLDGYYKRNLLKHIVNIEGNNPKVLGTSTTEGMVQYLAHFIAPYIKYGDISF